METKLCRICGKLGENYVHIFKTEGLKNKIETCLPIIVSPHCLLPDTICSECLENVDNFYSFIKNCLQNIIVLEAQYDITESCLKTKRKHEKSSLTDFSAIKFDKNIQTDDDAPTSVNKTAPYKNPLNLSLVSYDIESDSGSDHEDDCLKGEVVITPKTQPKKTIEPRQSQKLNFLNARYFDDAENDLISEIVQRKSLKRKSESILPYKTKIFKMDTSNRRKSKQPKKVAYRTEDGGNILDFCTLERLVEQIEKKAAVDMADYEKLGEYTEQDKLAALAQVEKEISNSIPQICLLCNTHFTAPSDLAAHVFEHHGIDIAQLASSHPLPEQPPLPEQTPPPEKKKKLPNLVKITDLKPKPEPADDKPFDGQCQSTEDPPTLQPSFVCPACPATLTNRADLFTHLRVKHPNQAGLMCGLCMSMSTSYTNLNAHLETCRRLHSVLAKYICKICCYSDDSSKTVENHVVVHDFILAFCKKQAKMFDPSDYIDTNANSESATKLTCTECDAGGFGSFKDFSTHRRSQHQIFHCDLCNKFYGRNSHLWKHVNRLHKGHPSITCQLCYKTSASKYHLAQHFNKIHSAKPAKQKTNDDEDFMAQKFRAFDFQSVRQSFMRQEMLGKRSGLSDDNEANLNSDTEDNENLDEVNSKGEDEDELNEYMQSVTNNPEVKNEVETKPPPKEIDSSSDLYTNIITNYTPPQNEGEFKCPKCFKGFHKKTLLKKHKKNCRPRLQKDLLTRCKTCSRIFKDRQSLTKHLINYHSEYACEICGQKVQSKCEIVSHIRFSHPNCHLFCHCGNILRNKADLAEHKRDHRNSFVCQFCADMLPTKIKLKMHILSLHRKILSLSCGICLKLFETQYILRDHVRLVHKNSLMPLTSCTVCGKNYGSKWKTYDHLNKSHGRIFKACKACLEVFESEEQLERHYSAAHANGSQNKIVNNQNSSVASNETKYESDCELEQANDDNNFDKNSCSELSNDAESFAPYPNKSEPPEAKTNDFADLYGQDTRISLLEKRLLGKKITEADKTTNTTTTTIIKPKNSIIQNHELKIAKTEAKEKKSSSKSFDSSRKSDYEDPDYSFSQNPSQNSSKRTVYVNSNDPSLCEICLKTWPAKKHLWQHYIRCHKSVAATVCGICLKTNDNYENLQTHLRETHPTLLHGQGFGSNFICRICGRYHNASSKLKLHMAIHENFDWSILEGGKPMEMKENVQKNNGFAENERYYKKENETDEIYANNDDINYESMIEQVECSSDSDVEDTDNDNDNENGDFEQKQEDSSSDDDTEAESVISENSLETQMLHNMLKEKQTLSKTSPRKFPNNQNSKIPKIPIKIEEYSSSDSDDSSNSTGSYSEAEIECYDNIKTENCSSDEDFPNSNTNDSRVDVYGRKPGELDSAIRSISYEHVENVKSEIDTDFCDLQSQSLNQNEIESAVDSIL